MALEIEDGTGKANGQTYVGVAEVRAFATARGVALSVDDTVVEAQLIKAMDYIEALETRFKGVRTNANSPTFLQALSFPRCGVRVGCSYDVLADDQIPANLAAAQCHLVIAQVGGAVLQPILDPNAKQVKRKKVDVLETEYFSSAETGVSFGTSPMFPAVDALLRPLMRPGGATAPAFRG